MSKLQYIPWSTAYFKHEACLERAKELRKSGKYTSVRVRNTILDYTSNGKLVKYSKIYVAHEGEIYE